eukprot:COSAG01_NODE_58620_length_305_cov_0.587379_1_plen_59_part_01
MALTAAGYGSWYVRLAVRLGSYYDTAVVQGEAWASSGCPVAAINLALISRRGMTIIFQW